MLLLEHDGKQLLAARGVPVAPGVLLDAAGAIGAAQLPPGPWVVKAQVATGGRGKAGGIRMAGTAADVATHTQALLGSRIHGHVVHGCRVEQQVAGGHETYLSLSVDPQSAGVRILMSATGGVDIESLARQPGMLLASVAAPDAVSVQAAACSLAQQIPGSHGAAMRDAAQRLTEAFFDMEALLLEVNPLFVRADGTWVAGDAKIILDDNALARHDDLTAMVHTRKAAYREAEFKLVEDFDYVELDADGEVGLVTTGAGLSMMLVDQMSEAGLRAFNFLDIRTGQMRGDPHRLLRVFECMREGGNIKVLLVNVFAGITHLGEFSRLLVHALAHTPALRDVPVVARLVGNGQQEARDILTQAGTAVFLEDDLEAALARVASIVKGKLA
jgi:succinyl-CoA synthetase beta subunit